MRSLLASHVVVVPLARRKGAASARTAGQQSSVKAPADPFEDLRTATARGDAAAAQCALEVLRGDGAIRLFGSRPVQVPDGHDVTLEDLRGEGILSPTKLVPEAASSGGGMEVVLLLGALAVAAAGLLRAPGVALALLLASLAAAVSSLAPEPEPIAAAPQDQRRATAHEAAHFLVGYLLGTPVRAYSVDAAGRPCVEFDDRTGPLAGAGFSEEALSAYCAVACAGIAGEGLLWEGALGGAEDLKALAQVMERGPAAAGLRGPREQMNFTRWGVLRAAALLRAHRASWERLQEAMGEGAGLCECIQAVEAAG